MKMRFLSVVLVAGILTCVSEAIAGEIRVVDGVGLTRAVKSVSETAIVTLTIKSLSHDSVAWLLVNVDGLAADVKGEYSGDHDVVFSGVRGGTWRIESKGSAVSVDTVRVTE